MAQPSQPPETRDIFPSIKALVADDPALMEEAITLVSRGVGPERRSTPEGLVARRLPAAASRNALRVLRYLLDLGLVDVNILRSNDLMARDTCGPPSLALLETVATYGWNVNPKPGNYPLLWFVVEHIDLVRWCLAHGARVDIPADWTEANLNGTNTCHGSLRPTILGRAAGVGTIETFELLRSQGAPLDRRTLHIAIEHERLDMMKHLVEVVGLDVNADGRAFWSDYHSCSTAICITAFRRGDPWRYRVILFWLLDHGADPDLSYGEDRERYRSAVECAEASGNMEFRQCLEEWRAKNKAKAERDPA